MAEKSWTRPAEAYNAPKATPTVKPKAKPKTAKPSVTPKEDN
jgi:hypothetical protein